MDTIRTYLDNIFGTLPQTEQVKRLKADLLSDMEAKYAALRSDGKSDSEAVARVIGEFGNIDELLSEMGIERPDPSALPRVSLETARDFIDRTYQAANQVGIAVATIILSMAVMIGWYGRLKLNTQGNADIPIIRELAPVIFLLIMVAACVAVLIRSNLITSDYRYIDDGEFALDYDAQQVLQRERSDAKKRSTTGVVVGVVLCILAPALLMIFMALKEAYALYGVCVLLALAAAAVYLFIRVGSMATPYNKLLLQEEYRPQNRGARRKKDAAMGVLWMVAVAVFLGWGFLFTGWKIAWIVFPIAGVLSGAVSSFIDKG